MTALAVAIEEAGLRKDWVAEQLGVPPYTLSRYLRGRGGRGARVDPASQLAFAGLLRRKRSWLFDEDGYARELDPAEEASAEALRHHAAVTA